MRVYRDLDYYRYMVEDFMDIPNWMVVLDYIYNLIDIIKYPLIILIIYYSLKKFLPTLISHIKKR